MSRMPISQCVRGITETFSSIPNKVLRSTGISEKCVSNVKAFNLLFEPNF